MGVEIRAQEENTANEYRTAVTRFNELSYLMSISPQYWIDFIWRWFGYGRETEKIVKHLKALSNKVTKASFVLCKSETPRTAFLGNFWTIKKFKRVPAPILHGCSFFRNFFLCERFSLQLHT